MAKNSKKNEFSKTLLIQESILIWIVTLSFLFLAFTCIINQYFGELPWLAAMAACPWAAYGISQACYYRKSEKENTRDGIKFESVMAQLTNDNNSTTESVENAEG